MTKRVLIRCDASPEIGFGHVVRCLALADELRDQHKCTVSFGMLQSLRGVQHVRDCGYLVYQPQINSSTLANEDDWLHQLVTDVSIDVLILDLRTDLGVQVINLIRSTGVLVISIDDPSDRRLAADKVFYPPVPQVERLDWSGFTGKRFVGWNWVLIRPQFFKAVSAYSKSSSEKLIVSKDPKRPFTFLVTMGGSDPAGFTLMALNAIEKIDGYFRVIVAIGGAFVHEKALRDFLTKAKRPHEIHRNTTDMATLMSEADLAIASFGVTAYELAVMRIPAVYLCLTKDHEESSSVFRNLFMSECISFWDNYSPLALVDSILTMLNDFDRRKEMAARSAALINGCGAKFIGNEILATFKNNTTPSKLPS